jgi:hypothetical protein
MMTLVNFLFFSRIEIVHPDPRIRRGSDDESISFYWMEGGGRDGMREGDGYGWMLPVRCEGSTISTFQRTAGITTRTTTTTTYPMISKKCTVLPLVTLKVPPP